jgi:hypothetical protein
VNFTYVDCISKLTEPGTVPANSTIYQCAVPKSILQAGLIVNVLGPCSAGCPSTTSSTTTPNPILICDTSGQLRIYNNSNSATITGSPDVAWYIGAFPILSNTFETFTHSGNSGNTIGLNIDNSGGVPACLRIYKNGSSTPIAFQNVTATNGTFSLGAINILSTDCVVMVLSDGSC